MKPKCAHKFQITGAITEDGKRVYSLCCPHCGKKATRKVKLPKPYDPSRSHRNAPGSTASKKKVETKPRTRIKPVSDKQKARNAEYSKLRKVFLEEHPKCAVFPHLPSDQVHHVSGRLGDLFLDTSRWLAVSAEGHRQIHNHPAWAKAQGYIQPIYS